MTKAQFDAKINELLVDTKHALKEQAKGLLSTGAVDMESADDNFILPKLVWAASLIRLAEGMAIDKAFLNKARKLARY